MTLVEHKLREFVLDLQPAKSNFVDDEHHSEGEPFPEPELKFLVYDPSILPDLESPFVQKIEIEQYALEIGRIRKSTIPGQEPQYSKSIKTGEGPNQSEQKWKLTKEEYLALQRSKVGEVIEKTRYFVFYTRSVEPTLDDETAYYKLEINIFTGRYKPQDSSCRGLVLCEIECKDSHMFEQFRENPPYGLLDVTNDPHFKNKALAKAEDPMAIVAYAHKLEEQARASKM